MALVVDTATTFEAISSFSFAHTCSGSNRVLIVAVKLESTVPSGVSYNSVAMTKIAETARTSIWKLVNPATGANNVVITAADTNLECYAISFTGADQTTGTSATQTAGTTSSTATLDITTTRDNSIVCDITSTTFGTFTVGANQTQRLNTNHNDWITAGSTEPKAAAGSVTMSWAIDTSRAWQQCAVEVLEYEASGGGAVIPQHNLLTLGVG